MGNECCSKLKSSIVDESNTLVISNSTKLMWTDNRKQKLEDNLQISKAKNSNNNKSNSLANLLDSQKNPGNYKRLVRVQSLIRKYINQKIYKIVVRKFRTSSSVYFSYIEFQETLSKNTFDTNKEVEKKTFKYKTGSTYTGEWLGGFRHGYGRMSWKDGTFYEGYWHLGCAEGIGEMQFSNQDIMRGEFKYNKLNGYGECFQAELGYNYKGNWMNDLQSGMGFEHWVDGSFYIGQYEMGKKEGFGKYQWADSSFFIGEWKDNKIHGYGIYSWADGRKFAGEWKGSKMNGYGLFTWKDGRSYRGEYKDDKKHNFGIYVGMEGKKYEGNWENGIQKNLGKYYKKDGTIKVGYFDEFQNMKSITDEEETKIKLKEIDKLKEITNFFVDKAINELRSLFKQNVPDLDFDALLA